MIVLLIARNLGYFLKAKVIVIRLFKRKHYVNKVLSQLGNVSYPLPVVCNANHGFGRMHANIANQLKLIDKMIKKCQRVR